MSALGTRRYLRAGSPWSKNGPRAGSPGYKNVLRAACPRYTGACKIWCDFDNGASSKIDDVLAEDGGLLHVLPLAVHLKFFLRTSRVDHSGPFLFSEHFCGTPPSWWWWWVGRWVAYRILVSAPVPFWFNWN